MNKNPTKNTPKKFKYVRVFLKLYALYSFFMLFPLLIYWYSTLILGSSLFNHEQQMIINEMVGKWYWSSGVLFAISIIIASVLKTDEFKS